MVAGMEQDGYRARARVFLGCSKIEDWSRSGSSSKSVPELEQESFTGLVQECYKRVTCRAEAKVLLGCNKSFTICWIKRVAGTGPRLLLGLR
jgi:hypothetical protein